MVKIYIEAQENIDPDHDDSIEKTKQTERALKDRVRVLLNMPPHSSAGDISIAQHAKNNHISPSFDLPYPDQEHRRLLEPIGNIPPVEAEERYYAMKQQSVMAA